MNRKLIAFLSIFLFSLSVFAREKIPEIQSDIFDQDEPVYVGWDKLTQRLESVREEREPFVLALAGGSARAYAHVGVLRVLEENNIKPDVIVANSMGAIIGMLYSAGLSPDDIEYLLTNIDLNSFFDLVFPTRGGVLNQRYFREVLMRLFPGKEFDLSDGCIPVVIPCEDLISKRLVYFASGDFSKIMTAAFSMIFTMEPVDYVIEEGGNKWRVKLTDAGTVDIGQLGIAMELSDNILLSTAFYTPKVNLNNIIVDLNRTFSIGKERAAVRDIHENNIPYIRNEVENFSFMDFTQVKKIIEAGEKCTREYLEKNPAPENGGFDSSDSEFAAMREERGRYARKIVYDLTMGDNPVADEFYAGVKIRPGIPLLDTPLFDLNEDITGGLYGFLDFGPVFLRGGVYAGGNNYGFDFTMENVHEAGFNFLTKGSLFWNYKGSLGWYAGQALSYKKYFFPGFYINPFVTGELNYFDLFCKTGMEISYSGDKIQTKIVPFCYYSYDIKNEETGDGNFRDYLGFGGNVRFDITAIPFIGFGLADTFRIQENDKGVYLVQKDLWRGDRKTANGYLRSYVNLLQGEIYYYRDNMSVSFMESFLLEKMKTGAYCDIVMTDNPEWKMPLAAGIFAETQFAFMGLYKINFMGYGGWDFSTQSPVLGITLKESW